jgi:hypothetical protein
MAGMVAVYGTRRQHPKESPTKFIARIFLLSNESTID